MEVSKNCIYIKVYVQPRASKDEICGIHGGALKMRLTAPPVDGKANKRCIELLSKELGVSMGSLELIEGHRSRLKKVRLTSIHEARVESIFKGIIC